MRRLRKNRFTAQRREVRGAPFYYIQTATDNIPWERIIALAGKNVQFVLEDGITPPEGLPVFTGGKLAERLLEREFLQQLRRIRPAKLTVVDYDGEQMDNMKEYFRYAQQIRVITGRTEQYTDRSMALLRETGASLLLSRDLKAAADSTVLYGPKGIRGRFFAPAGLKVFTLKPGEVSGNAVYYPKRVQCSEGLEASLPAGVSAMRFLSALYELSGFQRLEEIKLDIGLYI